MKVQTTVTVLSRDTVSVDAPKEMLTNVPYPTKGYAFSVRFRFVDCCCRASLSKSFIAQAAAPNILLMHVIPKVFVKS